MPKKHTEIYTKSFNGSSSSTAYFRLLRKLFVCVVAPACAVLITSCSFFSDRSAITLNASEKRNYEYLIGPGDKLNIFVWQNPEVSTKGIPVRPDGKIAVPLAGDVIASGKTSNELARDIKKAIADYIRDPIVTVTVVSFIGQYAEQIRVVGEAVKPKALPYGNNMTLLDVMILVQGLTPFADGNRAKLVRMVNGKEVETTVRLEDLVQTGDMSANVKVHPGDVLIIPQAWF
ncbi:MAG: polysaccharide export protein [Nitrososphaera sp.]|nr:polysaccharide export protein [Nitrososphaera sp.]